MTTRITLLALGAAFASAAVATPAAAGDFGISFSYSSSSPRCYTTYVPSSYYVYYDDYVDPLLYLTCATPRVVVYDPWYPATYCTCYSRSYCYPRPACHVSTSACRSRQRYCSPASYSHYYKPRSTSRSYYCRSGSGSGRHYSRPAATFRTHDRSGRSDCRATSARHRSIRPYQRGRVHRR